MALPKRIAVVGGGLSGLACARRLSEAFDVSVWDMGSRGPGMPTPYQLVAVPGSIQHIVALPCQASTEISIVTQMLNLG